MKLTNTIILILILSVLLFDSYNENLRPIISLNNNSKHLINSYISCKAASDFKDEIFSYNSFETDGSINRLYGVLDLLKSGCDELKIVENRLLADGVSPNKLEELKLLNSHATFKQEFAQNLDDTLYEIIKQFNLKPLPIKPLEETEKFKLGRALFYDPILSGNNDVSCSTCHLYEYGSSDGLSLSIGTGGNGIGKNREKGISRELHPRNSQDLWNRDHNHVSSMFWDGRVQVIDPKNKIFHTPLGARLPKGFDNAMAVQAVFPILTPDEMLGYPEQNDIASVYREIQNPLQVSDEIFSKLIDKIFGNSLERSSYQDTYSSLYSAAFPGQDPSIVNIGNALAHYIELAFSTRNTSWDSYLKGNKTALTDDQKKGAIIFYTHGRCVACHSGETFSDYSFHSLGVPDTDQRIMLEERDLGRYYATLNPEDMFKFRTPPLRNVTKSAPYFHNGTFENLYDVISYHNNPILNENEYHSSGRFLRTQEQVNSVSKIIKKGLNLDGDDISLLIDFLGALQFDLDDDEVEIVVPTEVPSGYEFHR